MLGNHRVALLIVLCSLGGPGLWGQSQPASSQPKEADKDSEAGAKSARLLALHIKQTSSGLPGQSNKLEADQERTQEAYVSENRLRLQDAATRQEFLMKTDQGEFFEILAGGKEYQRAADYSEIQEKRDRFEKKIRENDRLSESERRQALQDNYIRADGQRIVKTTKSEAPPIEIQGHSYSVSKFEIRENGRKVVEALVTTDLPIEVPFFEFYRNLGAFSDEVLTELQKIKGVPLQAEFLVVTSLVNHKIAAKIDELELVQVPASVFELPVGAKERQQTPFAICPVTNQRVEKTAACRVLINGVEFFFVNQAAFKEYKRTHPRLFPPPPRRRR